MVPMKEGDESVLTGVYKVKLSDAPVTLKQPLDQDPHCIATIVSYNTAVGFGADGLTFDPDGNMYIGNFCDGTMHKIEFDAEGNATTEKPAPVWAKAPFMKSCDGIFFNKDDNKIYVADSIANAVQIVSLDGSVQCLAQEPTDDGANGKLDQPAEVLVRGREVIATNFDMPVPGGVNQTFEVPNGLSVIPLD
jgi:DNA-binding beta-propeller fold protein YncE